MIHVKITLFFIKQMSHLKDKQTRFSFFSSSLSLSIYIQSTPPITPIPPVYFLLKEQPSVNLALPPVGVHNTVEHESQVTAV